LQTGGDVLLPAVVRRRRAHRLLDALRDRMDGCERIVDLVAENANEPLPRLTLLLAQRAAQIGEDQQLVRLAPEPERAAAELELPGSTGERQLEIARRGTVERCPEPQLPRVARRQTRELGAEEPLSRAVRQDRAAVLVEGEDRDLDLVHDPLEQRACFQRSQALLAERRRQLVE